MFFNAPQNNFKKFCQWVLYIFIATFPFIFYKGYLFDSTASRSINTIVIVEILAVICGFALFNKKATVSFAKSPIVTSFGLLFSALFISSLCGVDWASSFWSKATRTTGLFYFLHMGVLFFFFMMSFNEEKNLRSILKVFVVSGGVLSIGALLSKDGLGVLFLSKPWVGFTFGNSTFAGMYLYAAFIVSIYYVATLPSHARRWWKNLLPIVFVLNPYIFNREVWFGRAHLLNNPLNFIGEAQASSYTLFFSILLLFIVWLISKIKNIKIKRAALWTSVGLTLIISFFAINSLISHDGYLRQAYLKRATPTRPIVWNISREAIKDRPMLGWGVDNFDRPFEAHYDNSLLEKENGAEPWFDRAHNIFFDQTVETGYVGFAVYLLVYLVIIGCMIFVLRKSKERHDHIFAIVAIVYCIGHFMELQTAFDTSISYIPFLIISASAAIIFHKVYSGNQKVKGEWKLPSWAQFLAGVALIGSFGYFFFGHTVSIIKAQTANGLIRSVGSSEKRIPLYPVLFGSPIDTASFLWRTSIDLERGIAGKPEVINDPKKRAFFAKELAVYVEQYKKYLSKNPSNYRAHLDFAHVYIYERLFEVDHLTEAQQVLDEAIVLVPQSPQAYWMKAVAYLYMRKFDLAREWAQKAYDLNPRIEESQRVIEYINRSIKTFPEIDLFAFKLV